MRNGCVRPSLPVSRPESANREKNHTIRHTEEATQ